MRAGAAMSACNVAHCGGSGFWDGYCGVHRLMSKLSSRRRYRIVNDVPCGRHYYHEFERKIYYPTIRVEKDSGWIDDITKAGSFTYNEARAHLTNALVQAQNCLVRTGKQKSWLRGLSIEPDDEIPQLDGGVMTCLMRRFAAAQERENAAIRARLSR